MEKLLRRPASLTSSALVAADVPGSRAMKLVDEAVAPVVHAGTINETKAARRKASPESGGGLSRADVQVVPLDLR